MQHNTLSAQDELVKFTKVLNNANYRLIIEFMGTINKSNDKKINSKSNNEIEKCFEHNQPSDIEECISWIRTILRDYNELSLEINLQEKNNTIYRVRYLNKNLELYQMKNSYNQTELEYDSNQPHLFWGNISRINLKNYYVVQNLNEHLKEELDILYKLNNAESSKMNRDEMIICKLYNLFYGEDPDFWKKDTKIKIQAMCNILLEFGISVNYDYYFSQGSKKEMPISIELDQAINNLIPFGYIDTKNLDLELSPDIIKETKIIGSMICEYIKDNELETLKNISKTLYVRRSILSTRATEEEIAAYCKCEKEHIESNLNLIKKIYRRII